MKVKRFDTFRATIEYHNTNDLKPEALPNGSNILIQALWIADKDEKYAGQYVFMPANGSLWLPACDLKITERIDSDEYYKTNRLFMNPEIKELNNGKEL